MKLPNWLSAIFAPESRDIPIVRTRFAEFVIDEPEPQWKRNFSLTQEQRRARSLKSADTLRAKKAAPQIQETSK